MAVSPLATIAVPAYEGNYSGPDARTNITEITVHHMAGVLSAEQCGQIFQRPGRNGSSHYGIGVDGEIAWYVDENCVAWTNSNWPANQRAVTIEFSNCETGGDWPVSDATLEAGIRLIADIAKRNGLGHLVVGQNLTKHNDYAATSCPGPYLEARMQYIADKANGINEGQPAPSPTPEPTPDPSTGVKVGDKVVLKNWVDVNGTPLKQTRDFYYVSELASNGRAVLRADAMDGPVYAAVWATNLTVVDDTPTPAPAPSAIGVGDEVLPIEWVDYNGTPLRQTRDFYYVMQINGDRAVLTADAVDGPVYAAVNVNNLRRA